MVVTEQGFVVDHQLPTPPQPAALRIERLGATGGPVVEVDNTGAIRRAHGQGELPGAAHPQGSAACGLSHAPPSPMGALLSLLPAALLLRRRRRT